jgi:hypothetical protein
LAIDKVKLGSQCIEIIGYIERERERERERALLYMHKIATKLVTKFSKYFLQNSICCTFETL